MKILILGASGYIGNKVREELKMEYTSVYGTYHKSSTKYADDKYMLYYELGDDKGLNLILNTINPDIIISSLTGDFSLLINCHKILSNYIKNDKNKKIIFISTANVFDGSLEKVHIESDIPNAESPYGKFKIQCENLIINDSINNNILIRIPSVWGVNSPRLNNLIHNIKSEHPIKTFKNIYVNITTNKQIATWILYIIKNNLTGIFHIGSTDICDYNNFEEQLRQRLGLKKPTYEITEFENKSYQAVIPSRLEIPNSLMMTIDDITTYMVDNFNKLL